MEGKSRPVQRPYSRIKDRNLLGQNDKKEWGGEQSGIGGKQCTQKKRGKETRKNGAGELPHSSFKEGQLTIREKAVSWKKRNIRDCATITSERRGQGLRLLGKRGTGAYARGGKGEKSGEGRTL